MNTSAEVVALVLQITFLISLLKLLILCFFPVQTILLMMLICSICPGLLHPIYFHFDVFETLLNFPDIVDISEGEEPQNIAFRKPDYPNECQASASPAEVEGTGPETTPDESERVNMSAPLEDPHEMYPASWKEAEPEFGSPEMQGIVEKDAPRIPSTPRRTGLKPLTLTLTNLPSREVRSGSGSKRTVSLSNGFKRHSSVFYVSEHRQSRPAPALALTQTVVSDKSLPVPAANLLGNANELATMLKQDENQSTRLRGELKELHGLCRAREHDLFESKQQVHDFGAALEARDVTIRELCVDLESLQQENAVLKEAAWRVECLKVANDARAAELSDTQMLLRQLCMVVSGYRWYFARIQTQDWAGLRSVVKDHRDRVYRVGTDGMDATLVTEEAMQTPLATHNRRIGRGSVHDIEIARASSLDSIFKPTTSPTVQPSDSQDPSSRADGYFDLDEAKVENDLEEAIEFEFPTISPKFHPGHIHASARSQVVTSSPSPGSVIYEVDGSALVNACKGPEYSPPESTAQHQPLASDLEEGYHGQKDRLDQKSSFFPGYYLQGDSDFYAVPASAFVLPYPPGQGI